MSPSHAQPVGIHYITVSVSVKCSYSISIVISLPPKIPTLIKKRNNSWTVTTTSLQL